VSENLKNVTLLTIVAESLIEARLIEDLVACGVMGWTLTPPRGAGPANRRLSEVEGGNVKIEVLASQQVADAVWDLLTSKYFPHYAVTAWQSSALVSRLDRYLNH
jgi:nitrogen regulatory protein P-II 2